MSVSSASDVLVARRRFAFSTQAMRLYGVIAATTFGACSSAPTPLYHVYQADFGLSPVLVTMIFASYAFSLLFALLTVGSLSDYIGRRPVIFMALALNAVALLIFMTAGSATGLITARIIQGLATGAATTTLGAAILDTDRARGPLLNSIAAFLGLTIGAIGAGVLVSFAPLPTELVFALLLVITIAEIGLLALMPETTPVQAGALASLRPRVRVPVQARTALMRVSPVNIAAWALAGFYLSLVPTLVGVAIHLTSPVVGGAVVSALMFAAMLAVLVMRNWAASRVLASASALLALGVAVTLGGVYLQHVGLLVGGTLIAGVGLGAGFSGTLRAMLPLADASDRAALISALYVENYLAFSLPAIGAGVLAPILGLVTTTYLYGALLIGLAAISLLATVAGRPAGQP